MDEQQEQYEADMSAQGQAEAEAGAAEAEAQEEAKGQTMRDLSDALNHSRNEWEGISLKDIAVIIIEKLGKDAETLVKEIISLTSMK